MKPTNKKCRKDHKELSIADLLCSVGYLPPRDEQDIERFERIYSSRKFETESYTVNANAIFDKATGEDKSKIQRLRPMTTIFDRPGALRVAEGNFNFNDDSVAESFKVAVEAFPASSQDAETMVCAETAVWATMEYFGNRYAEYSPVRPSHIIKLLKNQSFSRQLPSSGLTSEQICYLFKNMNFQPILRPVNGEESDYSMIGSFVESGIPVVLSITNYVDETYPVEDRVAHAILCIGHERVKEEEVNSVKSYDDNGLLFIDYDNIKKRFIFIDDNCPAYRMDYLKTPADSYTEKKWKDCRIRFASYPLYEKILLMPYSVKCMATNFLHFVPGINDGREITMRTFLASSRSYKDYVCRNNMSEEIREMILNLYLPKFIWVVELSSRRGLLENYAEGLLIFDSTEPKLTNLTPLELMYYNGQAVYKDDNRKLQIAVNVPNEKFNSYQKNLR